MTTTTLKFTLAAAALSTLSLVAADHAQAQPTAPKDPFQDASSFSLSTVTQSRGRLGAKVITMSADLRAFFGAPKDRGLLVDSVLSDTPAAKAGLKSGDVIVAVSGEAIGESWDIFKAMSGAKKGDAVKVEIIRDKKKRTLTATLDSEGQSGMGALDLRRGGIDPRVFDKGFGKDFGKDFPFNHGPMNPAELLEKMQRLEERLDNLEGNGSSDKATPHKATPGKPAPKKSRDKPFRGAPAGAGNTPL